MPEQTLQSPLWFRLNYDDVANDMDKLTFSGLPPLVPHFFVPNLQDKPQNPIVEQLKLSEKNREATKSRNQYLPPELHIITNDLLPAQLENENSHPEYSICDKLDLQGNNRRSQLLSWDALRPVNSTARTSTPFLSETDNLVYASARHHVQPRLNESSTHLIHVNQAALFSSLEMTVLGNSSVYHSWDPYSARFLQRGTKEGKQSFLLLDGMDEVISDSIMSRFLTIGNLVRRLEILLESLRHRSANDGPTIFAFAHALSNVMSWVLKALAGVSLVYTELPTGNIPISRVWMRYELFQEILTSLAELCGREEMKTPSEFDPFKYTSICLLSRIHTYLDAHFTRQSPRTITAIFAYILTCTSQEYLRQVGQSVGYGPQSPQKLERVVNPALDEYNLDEDVEGDEKDIFEVLEKVDDDHPSFFPSELLATLPAARRSLILLRKAQPDHPILIQPVRQTELRWLWKEEDVRAAYFGIQKVYHAQHSQMDNIGHALESSSQIYKPGLEGFQVFDMEPGSSMQSACRASKAGTTSVQDFLDSFPNSLPPITPTFSDLSSVVFSDLLRHSSTLSSTLLDMFLNHPCELSFRSHLVLLRDFLLLTSPLFKLKLSLALFSDKEDYEIDNKNRTWSLSTLRQRKHITESTQPWAVGLASSLLEREIWPPVGADLSFLLRTVIVDSLEYPQGGSDLPKRVVNDASWRLGFAIRELPTGPGRDKWLNPLCVEALDFLYMDYKPPHPLEVLIPSEVLSKYQRMFTFLLRLIRIEHALHAVQRIIRAKEIPIFPTLTSARKLTLHFRFMAQSFMSALSRYVFDTVIRGNFGPFLAELVPRQNEDGTRHRTFSDVFELAKRHSNLLDDILSACLMRSGQRMAGDLLRQATEIVLEFAVVIGELRRGRLQEYEAAPMVEDLFGKFRTKMGTLIKVLHGLVDKSSSKPYEHLFIGQRNLPGGLEALHNLLLRIDISNWWAAKPQ